MPPRYSYWTILAGGLPTAFRAAEREDLLATFARLREKHPDAVIRWFARGKLWESPEEAKAAVVQRDGRGRDWRPGGTHRDPRQPYIDAKKDRNLRARRDRFENRQRGDQDRGAPPSGRPTDPATRQGERPLPPKPPASARDREGQPPRQDRPRGVSPASSWKPNDRPKSPAAGFRPDHRGPRDEARRDTRSPAGSREERPQAPRDRPPSKGAWTPKPKWAPRGEAPVRAEGSTRPHGGPRPSWKPNDRPKSPAAGFRPEHRGPRDEARRDSRSPAGSREERPQAPRDRPPSKGAWTPKPKWAPRGEAPVRTDGSTRPHGGPRPSWKPNDRPRGQGTGFGQNPGGPRDSRERGESGKPSGDGRDSRPPRRGPRGR